MKIKTIAISLLSSRILSTALALIAVLFSLQGYVMKSFKPQTRYISNGRSTSGGFDKDLRGIRPSLFGPSVGAVYVTHRRPKAFLHAMTAFRAAYPEGDIVVLCDRGCHNYSKAAKHFGATYFDDPRQLSTKQSGAIYVGREEAKAFVSSYRDAVNLIKNPYWMQLEDDVFVFRRIPNLPFQINGWAPDKHVKNEAERYVRNITKDMEQELKLGGFGGCVYETKFWRTVFNDKYLDDFVKGYFDAGVSGVGQDYLFSSILYARNGTMGPMEGYVERFHGDLVMKLAMGKVTVFHGFKDLYNDVSPETALTDEELQILGDNWISRE
jgi:hypothetical protein